ncbi:MAG: hypothetical protein HZA15_05375 [Nitrospirae bacterium]|nr:hypothetical protein [Nitrospirota bacterium]
MTRKPAFTCFNQVNAFASSLLIFAIINPAVFAIMFLLIPFFTASTHAEETKIFTDADLEKYNARPMVDQETISKSEEELNSYLIKKSADLFLEKEALKKAEMKKQQAEGTKRLIVQQQRKKAAVSQEPVSVRRITGST